ncbi:MAG: hypothetical protein MR907_04365, partial [Firmicutes bacterium]|nr:hypothetical protein [Bacillota bacterium]
NGTQFPIYTPRTALTLSKIPQTDSKCKGNLSKTNIFVRHPATAFDKRQHLGEDVPFWSDISP